MAILRSIAKVIRTRLNISSQDAACMLSSKSSRPHRHEPVERSFLSLSKPNFFLRTNTQQFVILKVNDDLAIWPNVRWLVVGHFLRHVVVVRSNLVAPPRPSRQACHAI